jgi:hypothetical protein
LLDVGACGRELRAGLRELGRELGCVDLGEDLAGGDLVANIHVPRAQVAGNARVELRLLERLHGARQ